MKMRKLLATAVAATMAVTSLATVASAAEKSWNMGHTTGTIKFNATSGKEVNFLATEEGLAPAELGISADDTIAIITTDATKKVTGVTLKVTGVKGSKASASKTYSYAFGNYDSDTVFDWTTQKYDASGKAWALTAYATSGNLDSFVPSQFVEITQVSIEIACESEVDNAKAYDAYGSTNYGENIDGLKIIPFANAKWTDILMVINNSLNAWGTTVVDSTGIYAAYSDKSTKVDYPFMPVTKEDSDDKLGRKEIKILSVSNDYFSNNIYSENNTDGSNQSYVDDDTTAGEVAKDFAGLSTQVADFFNKQTNGTITFKFTTGTEAGGTAWENGGIPSTQTGIKNFMGDATANDFALFFNYRQTGSLQAIVELDKDAGTVTFDISDILDALGGQTLGVLDNMYYGLQKGIEYKDIGTGLMVETVTLAYDEDADVEADIEDDAEEDDADVEIEEDDDVEIEEDDDVEEDDADTAGDVVVEDEDDDANPGTGVALAVVPAMVAAAAVVLSKKRK